MSGATTRCRRLPTASARGRRATAGARVASRPGSAARAFVATTSGRTGQALDAPAIAAAAEGGHRGAQATPAAQEDRLARALAGVINILDPDVIVLGGGRSRLQRLGRDAPPPWARHVFSDRVDTRLRSPHHGDCSAVRGAVRLWPPGAG